MAASTPLTVFTGDPGAPADKPITFDVTFRVTVSPDGYDLIHGSGTLPEAVRDEVVDQLHSHLQQQVRCAPEAFLSIQLHNISEEDRRPPG